MNPDVQAAAIIGVPDPDEGQVPIAFVVPEPDRLPTAEGLARFLEARIARYKIPARYYFISALPLTRSGKIDHNALRTMLPPTSDRGASGG